MNCHGRLVSLVLVSALLAGQALAQPMANPVAPKAALAQRPGAPLPLGLALVDEADRPVKLGDYFGGGRPVLLVLGYYRCPELCGLLMHGLLEALQASGVSRRDVRILRVSIDPQDTPATAAARRDVDLAYADFLLGAQSPDTALDLHLLVGTADHTARLAGAVGFTYEPAQTADSGEEETARYAHPAAVVVVTPQGRVSRYLTGIRFDPAELRSALLQASQGRIGGLTDRIALLCAHFDPHWGRYSTTVMTGLRVLGLSIAAALGLWCWRRRLPGGLR
jgi:protein SCO1